MNTRTPFVSQVEATKSVEPRERALDDPPGASESAAVRAAAFRQLAGDPALFECVPMWLRVVTTVALDHARSPRGRPGRPRNGGMPSTKGSSWVTSCRFADVRRATTGIPVASVRT